MARRDLDLIVLRRGTRIADFTAKADPRHLHQPRQWPGGWQESSECQILF
jgi:hypothetical protein